MGKPLTFEQIKSYIESEEGNGCVLLTTKEEFNVIYKNNETKLLIKCKCGENFLKGIHSFKKGQKQCKNCGRKNGNEKHKKRVIVKCDYCGKNIERTIGKMVYEKYFCDLKCKGKWKSLQMKGNKINEGRFLTDDIKKKISKANKGRLSGSNNPNYNPEMTDEERERGRKILGYQEFIKEVYKRDNYTCQKCGDNKGGNLVAHHLNGYDTFKEQRTDVNNGVTLCNVCHKEFHSLYGYGNNTKEQYEEWISK